jgi:hypothetical protein
MNSEVQERLDKFSRICDELKKHDIKLVRVDPMGPVLQNTKTKKTLLHNIMTWQEFPEQQVIDWVVASLPSLEAGKKEI